MNQLLIDHIDWKKFHEEDVNWNETHVFNILIDEYFEKIQDYKSVLSNEELANSNRYQHYNSKITYITSRYFIRKILCLFKGENDPSSVSFYYKDNKKPATIGAEFNISHSGNHLLVAVNVSTIGVDIELIKKDFNFESILETCFNPNEIEVINQSEDKSLKFYNLWTRKEALLKATGEGLVDNLSAIDCLSNPVSRNGSGYRIKSFMLDGNYIASLAILSSSTLNVNYWKF
ncbi:4'-phosphopantetheinyl transferase family protein [Pedobacter paludis]|uniref:4'-phosphopantetheinyl transferase domain-containing protein n=1 Tax=Pedobacter paludis TaxID=2203212 RepID=A0A317F3K0_9SPHI|nr:4'-phosphopantetheinyl transferase superfamily protein [Pedobacter paludis]PWS33751.1 hypothetical protein DF947_03835 [Pedobacter paludis]